MRLDKSQICPTDLSLNTSNDRSDRSIPSFLPGGPRLGISRLHTLDVDWMVGHPFLSTVNQGVNVWFEYFGIVDVGGVT